MPRSPIYLSAEELERECRFERLRRSGPGGQNRNKVETAVRFHHLSTGLVGEATERRYQAQNRRIALERLRIALALTVRGDVKLVREENEEPRLEREYADSLQWFSRLVGDKIKVSSSSYDYPILVSEFFDVYLAVDEDLTLTAKLLHTTASQIVKLLAAEPKTLQALNEMRVKRGLGRLTH